MNKVTKEENTLVLASLNPPLSSVLMPCPVGPMPPPIPPPSTPVDGVVLYGDVVDGVPVLDGVVPVPVPVPVPVFVPVLVDGVVLDTGVVLVLELAEEG